MTVIDLRERLGFGWRVPSTPSPRLPIEVAGLQAGRELHRRGLGRAMWRVAPLDCVSALLGVLVCTAIWGGAGLSGSLIVVFGWLMALYSAGAYRWTPRRLDTASIPTLARAFLQFCAGAALLSVVVDTLNVSLVVSMATVVAPLTILGRRLWAEDLVGVDKAAAETVLVRGGATEVASFLGGLDAEAGRSFTPIAVQVTEGELAREGAGGGLDQLHASADVVAEARAQAADAVLLVGAQPESSEDLRRIIWRLEGCGIGVYLAPVVADLAPPLVSSMPGTGIPMFAFSARDRGAEAGLTKVIIDKVLALVALVVLLPVIAVTALAVRMTSTGPVLFRQVRVGLRGREFEMLKFRTMYMDAEFRRADLEAMNSHPGGTLFKIPDDPRITRTGRVLRKYSLDELPQLMNVLRGEMSLVGPRPPLPEEVANYPLDAHRRFCVRPGLTGLWQVSGRSNLDPEESVRLDAHYVEQWSPAMDVSILARTPKAVVSGEGAY